MTKKEPKKVEVIAQLEAGGLKIAQASVLLVLSERLVKRLRKANWEKGTMGPGKYPIQEGKGTRHAVSL